MSIHSTGLGDFGQRVVSPRVACSLLSCSRNTLYRLIAKKKLETFLLGRSRKITLVSIQRLIEDAVRSDVAQ
jgi:excisionase family DNA binding protein